MIANALSASPMASKASPFMSKARAVLTNPYFWLMAALFLVLLLALLQS
ncbi:hypothetical protein [Serratia nevei]